jgi:plasmid maintenance system antidote protein VapI
MNVRAQKTKPNRLDLVRRARALGVTHGHLSRVISGRRVSISLTLKLNHLIADECKTEKQSAKATNDTKTK